MFITRSVRYQAVEVLGVVASVTFAASVQSSPSYPLPWSKIIELRQVVQRIIPVRGTGHTFSSQGHMCHQEDCTPQKCLFLDVSQCPGSFQDAPPPKEQVHFFLTAQCGLEAFNNRSHQKNLCFMWLLLYTSVCRDGAPQAAQDAWPRGRALRIPCLLLPEQ